MKLKTISLFTIFITVFFTNSVYSIPVLAPSEKSPFEFIDSTQFSTTLLPGTTLTGTSSLFGPGFAVVDGPLTIAQATPFVVQHLLTKGVTVGENDSLVFGFQNIINIVNGPGDDLVVWEAGFPAEGFYLALSNDGGTTFTSNIFHNTFINLIGLGTPPFPINSIHIDLSLFGFAPNETFDAVRIQGFNSPIVGFNIPILFDVTGGNGPNILGVAALNVNPIPEPSTIALVFFGAGAIVMGRRRMRMIS